MMNGKVETRLEEALVFEDKVSMRKKKRRQPSNFSTIPVYLVPYLL